MKTLLSTDSSSHICCKSSWRTRDIDYRLVASPTKEAAGNAVEASQILGAVRIAETPGAALVVKEVAGNVADASHEPEQLNEIVKFEEAEQIDCDPEQLNEIFEVEEAAQTDPELEQLNHGFPDTRESWLKQVTLYICT